LRGWPLHTSMRALMGAALSGALHDANRRIGLSRARAPNWAGARLARLAGDAALGTPEQTLPGSIRELSITQLLCTSVPYQLHSEDRNSMLHSVESRLPFLDYRLVEFGVSLPDEYKIRDGATKAVVREGLRGVLPDAIIARHDKVGFAAPEQPWIRRNSAGLRLELAHAIAEFPGLLRDTLLPRFDAMIAGRAAYDPAFFRVIAFGRWARIFQAVR